MNLEFKQKSQKRGNNINLRPKTDFMVNDFEEYQPRKETPSKLNRVHLSEGRFRNLHRVIFGECLIVW